jgi:hypothetical protein
VNKNKYVTIYTREGKQELTFDEWCYFDESKLHRDGYLPAVEFPDGSKQWFKYGETHRETGPAIVWANGHKNHFLAGRYYSEEDLYKKLKEVDELPLSLALTHPEEWVRERAKKRQ